MFVLNIGFDIQFVSSFFFNPLVLIHLKSILYN